MGESDNLIPIIPQVYNPKKDTIFEGFGMTREAAQQLAGRYLSEGSYSDILDRIVNDEDLPPNQQAYLLIEFGVRMTFNEIAHRAEAEQNDDALTDKGEEGQNL